MRVVTGRVFRPRATLLVCVALSVAFVAGAAVLLATLAASPADHTADRVAIGVVTAAVLLVSVLLGRVRAVADDTGLSVRNPLRSARLRWEQILEVRLGRHDSWVQLDLADGGTCAVMAVQAADGERARRDAAWLRARVAEHEGTEPG